MGRARGARTRMSEPHDLPDPPTLIEAVREFLVDEIEPELDGRLRYHLKVAINVLADPAIRDGIKTFSDWPTIPQLYVNGTFVGGCDIVREMHETGDLAELIAGPRNEIVS